MRLGVDIEKVARFSLPADDPFLTANFTEEERSYAFAKTSPPQHLCGMFCAKEAAKKTLDTPVEMRAIRVTREESGRPLLEVEGCADSFEVSISHAGEYAVAAVIRKVEGRGD